MSACPPTCTNGLGIRPLKGLIRVPSPAASTMAHVGPAILFANSLISVLPLPSSNGVQGRHVSNIPCAQGLECGMTERALQIAPHPRHVAEILRLAVAHVETGEDAEDFACALRGKRDVHLDEPTGVEFRISLAPAAHIASEQRQLHLLDYIHPGILEQRGEIVCGRTYDGVLEVQHSEPSDFAPARQPQ